LGELTKKNVHHVEQKNLKNKLQVIWCWNCDYEEDNRFLHFRNKKFYRKCRRYEKIKTGAMQSWNGGELFPIINTDGKTIGDIPASFDKEREFYNPC
jgi:hypothetical protein